MNDVYRTYLESEWWQTRRQVHLRDHPRCEACGTSHRLHVHHVSYLSLGDENAADLATLCRECHSEVHRIHEQWPTMTLREATLTVVYRQHAA